MVLNRNKRISLYSKPLKKIIPNKASFVIYIEALRPRLYGEKLSRVEGSPAYPSYPGRANFSYISLQNLANRLHEKQKVGSARRVTRLAGLPFCDGRVTLLAGPTFLHINTLAHLAGSTRLRRDDQTMRELYCYWKVSSWLGQRGQHFSHINAR